MTYNTFNQLDYVRQDVAQRVVDLRNMLGDPKPEDYVRQVRKTDVKSVYPADWKYEYNEPDKISLIIATT